MSYGVVITQDIPLYEGSTSLHLIVTSEERGGRSSTTIVPLIWKSSSSELTLGDQ